MTTATSLKSDSRDLRAAASRLYDAEAAMHAARQTGEGNWIRAAADRLHEAVLAYTGCQGRLAGPQHS
jgi:hypothetical protein